MDRRPLFHSILEGVMDGAGLVYFQPPTNITLTYPCIVYERAKADTKFADNAPYLTTQRYTVTVIEKDVDSAIPSKVATLPMCTHSTFFTAENLNHDVFDIYF